MYLTGPDHGVVIGQKNANEHRSMRRCIIVLRKSSVVLPQIQAYLMYCCSKRHSDKTYYVPRLCNQIDCVSSGIRCVDWAHTHVSSSIMALLRSELMWIHDQNFQKHELYSVKLIINRLHFRWLLMCWGIQWDIKHLLDKCHSDYFKWENLILFFTTKNHQTSLLTRLTNLFISQKQN